MLNQKRASAKLYFLILFFSIFIVVIGRFGAQSLQTMNENTGAIFNDRMLPLKQLTQMRYAYATGILITAEELENKLIKHDKALQQIEIAEKSIAKNWNDYLKTKLTKQEALMVNEVTKSKLIADTAIKELKLKIALDDSIPVNDVIDEQLYSVINPLVYQLNELAQLQIEITSEIKIENEKIYKNAIAKFYLFIILLVIIGGFLGHLIILDNKFLIANITSSFNKLKIAEEKCRTFIKYAGDAVFIIDKEFNIVETNESACNLLGYTEAELKSKKMFELLNENEREDFHSKSNSIKNSGGSIHERQFLDYKGRVIDVEANVKPLSNDGFVTIIRDITERKKSQMALAQSEAKYKYLFQHNPACIIVWSLETLKVLEVNEEVVNKYGYSKAEWDVMSVLDYRPEEHHQDIIDFAKRMLMEEIPMASNQWKHLKKNGEEMFMEITSHKIKYNNQNAILSLAKDITEQVRSENSLRKSEEKFHALLDNAEDSIFIVAFNGQIIEVNQSACKLLGYTREEFLQSRYLDFYPKNFNHHQTELWDVSGVNKILVGENKLICKNENLIDVEISLNLLPDTTYGIAIVRDISERKKIEAELYEKKEQLALFVEYSPASLAMFDTEMRYIATSKRWIQDYNITTNDIIGKTHYQVFPEIPEHWRQVHARCLNGSIERMEEDAFIREDGSIEWLKWEIRPWYKSTGVIGGIIMFTEVITERKKATELFNYQFYNSPDTIFIIKSDFIIRNINKGQTNGKSVPELIGTNCLELLPEGSRSTAKEAIVNCFKTGENQNFEIKIEFDRWAQARLVGIKVNGTVESVMVISSDITISKNAENKLRQSDEKQRVLIENISDAIITLDANLSINYHSPSATRIIGYESSETIGTKVIDYLYSEDKEACIETINLSKNNPNLSISYQFRVVHKNGHIIWVEGTILNLLGNESVNSYIINYRDVSERKKFEKQQRLITSIVDSTDDAIISKDMSGVITSWNKGAEKLLGYSANEVINSPITILISDKQLTEEKMILEAIQNGHSIDHFETTRLKKGGDLIDVSLTISPIKDDFGNIVGASKIMRDISNQKLQEKEKQQVINELFNQNTALQQFAYMVSHNLRGPVANIIGIADYLTEDNIDISKQGFLLNGLKTSINKLDGVIGDLNGILSIKGPTDEHRKYILFQGLVKDICNSISSIIENENVKIITDFQVKGMSTVRTYSYSVFYNIISNSIKYRHPQRPAVIKISSRMVGSSIEIIFEDNGIGIDMARNGDKLFGLYKRFHSHTEGKGMGLFMVKTQVETLGGIVSIESEIDVGTTIKLKFDKASN